MKKIDLSMQALEPLIKKIEELDKVQRIAICVVTVLALGAAFYFFYAAPKMENIKRLGQEYASTNQKLQVAKKKASQLERLKKEWQMKEAEFRKVMKALPEKKEIPSLLTSISQSGQDTGVKFQLFQPQKETNKEFYGEIPVKISMTGPFHNTILFFDKVTSLNRIVNIRNVSMKSGKGGQIVTGCNAVTYKFIEQKEGQKGKKKRRRR